MSTWMQIWMLLLSMQWIDVNSKPFFQGIDFHRSFGISLKPLARKPIAFIKEKWSPFGVFGSRHAIQKRDLDSISPPENVRIPIPPIVRDTSLDLEKEVDSLETSPSEVIPIPVQPPIASSNFVIPPPNRIGGVMPSPGLYTDITRADPINRYLAVAPVVEEEYPLPVPLPPRVSQPFSPQSVPPSPSIVNNPATVSEMPLGNSQMNTSFRSYLTNAFLQFLSQFFNNARMTLSRFAKQT